MDISSLASAASSAVTAPLQASAAVFRKAVEIPAEQSLQLIQMVANQAGLGNNLDISA